jgi:hypothetical protein
MHATGVLLCSRLVLERITRLQPRFLCLGLSGIVPFSSTLHNHCRLPSLQRVGTKYHGYRVHTPHGVVFIISDIGFFAVEKFRTTLLAEVLFFNDSTLSVVLLHSDLTSIPTVATTVGFRFFNIIVRKNVCLL